MMTGLALFASLLMLGCASLRPSEYHQAVLIRSEPAGAKIFSDGQAIGLTPSYVRLRRQAAPRIEIRSAENSVAVKLDTKYRWSSSFFSNLIFYICAPIGWAVDFLTGNAWNIQDSPIVKVTDQNQKSRKTRLNIKPDSYAIAPPLADSLELSDAAGRSLEIVLQSEHASPVLLDYDKTLPTFVSQGYDFDGRPEPENRRNLYHLLQTTGIYESELKVVDDKTTLTTRAYDSLNKTYGVEKVLVLESDPNQTAGFWNWHNWLRLLPNTLSFDSTNDHMTWALTNGQGSSQSVQLGTKHGQDTWDQIANAVTAINLTNLPIRRLGRASRIQLSFVPAAHLSHQSLQAENNPAFHDTPFTRTWISAGYGIELGWQVSRNYLYLNFVPQAYWDRIDWRAGDENQSRTGIGLTLQTELGYLYFITDHWNASIFTRSFSEDKDTWGRALASASGQPNDSAGTLTRSLVGVSVGYRFGSTSKLNHWIRSNKTDKDANLH